jgi:hypothetical protein
MVASNVDVEAPQFAQFSLWCGLRSHEIAHLGDLAEGSGDFGTVRDYPGRVVAARKYISSNLKHGKICVCWGWHEPLEGREFMTELTLSIAEQP